MPDGSGNYGSDSRVFPTDAQQRKETPIFRGLLMYFPDACAEVAHVSYVGNEQHNPGQPMHWARGKSTDQEDCLVRHLMERGTRDVDGMRHSAKAAWRALALLQLEIEAERCPEPVTNVQVVDPSSGHRLVVPKLPRRNLTFPDHIRHGRAPVEVAWGKGGPGDES